MPFKRISIVWGLLLSLACAVPGHAEDFAWEEVEILHLRAGFPLTGTHLNAECTDCHSGAVFSGTPTRCASCHARGGQVTASARSPRHLPTNDDCDACHTEQRWEDDAVVDHMAVRGDCHGCHNGAMAAGMGMRHIRTGKECGDCHYSTLTFDNARFDHNGIGDPCAVCHNGSTARGVPSGHLSTAEPCDVCHDTRDWGHIHFDHSGVTPGTCNTCHDGRGATGLPSGHLTTTEPCDVCHDTNNWDNIHYDHGGVAPGTCDTCHNGRQATGMPDGHVATTLACDACHTTGGWTPAGFTHTSAAYPGDHRQPLSCEDCHVGGGATVRWRNAALAPGCGGCHEADFRPVKHPKIDNPRANYTASELTDCTGACHIYEDPTMTQYNAVQNGPHHRVSDSSFAP